ncbi:MAG TPA: SDR family oxidoreductase [Burkholderiales bacterium]|nr:SDR family oxidoreductase [Burkholderiales bacterium]
MKLLDGERALVTGAARGIGKGMVAALREEGAQVLGADIEEADVRCDLSTADGARWLADEAIRKLEKVSLFVHCASPRRQENQHVLAVTEAQWREMINVNVDAAFVLCQTLGRHMVEKKIRGRILLTTSLHAETPRNLPHYSASKAAETMLVKEFAKALGPHGIRVNAVAPGAIPGGGFNAPPGLVEKIPLQRFGTPADVAAMAVAVLSERFGAYVTGATIVVDGGIALHNWIDPAKV